ncbi:MAG: hypothetical protein AB200_01405 [Parcubacteria bacterium C7867-005]|nr:MAG: hypothetical protein AB200_01405 [Parcubacteria bacterium C7867-005]
MSNVQFEEDIVNQYSRSQRIYRGLTGLVIRTGLVKNQVQANIVFIGSTILFVVGTIFSISFNVFNGGGGSNEIDIRQVDQTKFL